MDNIKYGNIVDFVHMLIKTSYLGQENLQFVDATCGNGFDTLFLCDIAGDTGQVKGFDIQEQAIEKTKKLLQENTKYNNYEIIKDSHEFIGKYLNGEIHAALFNLGYLPSSDKRITTNPVTTVKALKNLLPYLKTNGKIYVTTYILHDEGRELKEVFDYLSSLNKSKYNIINIRLINKDNCPPEIFIIEKNA